MASAQIKNLVKNKFIVDTAYSIFILGLASLLNYLYHVNIANRLEPSEFAVFSTLMAIVGILQVAAITIKNIYTKAVAQNLDKNLSNFFSSTMWRFLLITIGIILLLILFIKPISGYSNIKPTNMAVMAAPIAMVLLAFIPQGFLLGQQRVKLANTIASAELIPMVIWSYFVQNARQAVLAYSIPTLLLNLATIPLIKFKKKAAQYVPKNLTKRQYIYFFSTTLLLTTPITIDIILTPLDIKPEYSALTLLGRAVYFAASVIASIMFANVSKKQTVKKKKQTLYMALAYTGIIGSTLILTFTFASEFMIEAIFLGKYALIEPFLGWIALAMTLFALCSVLSHYLMSDNKHEQLLILGFGGLMQILLLVYNNASLSAIVTDQLIFFSTLFAALALYTWYSWPKTKN